jgi:hypothetical protein
MASQGSPVGLAPKLSPTWTTFREAIRVVVYPPFLKKTILTSFAVGLVLFSINHVDEMLRGQASTATWVKGGVTCLVPFCVSNWGILIATRRPRDHRH